MGCPNKRMIGRSSVLELAIQCTNEDPALTDFKPLGAVTTKSKALEGNVMEANDSFSSSGFTESQLSTSSISISVSGNFVNNSSTYANAIFISELERYYFNSVKVGLTEDPVVCVRYTRPDNTLTAYMIITSISVEDPDAEFSTFSMELALATSPTYPPALTATPE